MRIYLLCILLFYVMIWHPPASVRAQTLKLEGEGGTGQCDTLACWLATLTIVIPPQDFSDGAFKMHIDETTCTNITIVGLNSTLPSPLSIELGVSGIGIHCTTTWHATYYILKPSGGLTATVSDSSLIVGMEMHKNSSDGLVDDVERTICAPVIIITDLEFSGGIVDDLMKLFKNRIKEYMETELEKVICDELTELIETNLTNAFQKVNEEILPYINPEPLPVPYTNPTGFVDLRSNAFVETLEFATDSLIGANGPLGLNMLVNRYTNNTGGIFMPNITASLGETLEYEMSVGTFGNVTIGLLGVIITGLNQWSDVNLFIPIDNYTLDFDLVLADLEFSLNFFVRVHLGDVVTGADLYEEGVLSGKISRLELESFLYAGLNASYLDSLAANQLLSLGCLKESINVTKMLLLATNFTIDTLVVTPVNGSAETDVDKLITDVAALFIQSFAPAIPAFANSILMQRALPFVNIALEYILPNYHLPCAPPKKDEPTYNATYTFFAMIAATGLFLIIGLYTLFIKFRQPSRHADKDIEPLLGTTAQGTLVPRATRGSEALVVSRDLSFVEKYGILVLILANVALFVSSNASTGASVYLEVKPNDQEPIVFPSLFDFSLINSVRDMWKAKVYALSILIAVCSGIWPYVKLLLLLISWLVPGRILGLIHRERILLTIDALGKCSLIDSFVMMLMMVAFHFSLQPSVSQYTPEGTIYFQTWVVPHYGYYAFIISTILSLLITHLAVRCHRKVCEDADAVFVDNYDKKSLLAYSRRGQSKGSTFVVFSIAPLLVVAIALVLVGTNIDSFDFEFKGAFGYLLKVLDQPTTTVYSVLSLGKNLPNSSEHPLSAGMLFIQITFFIFVFAMPLLYLLFLTLLWVWPFSFHQQRKLLHLTETAQAWSSLEVFVVAVIAALVELQQFAQFIVGDRCDKINPILEKYADKLLDGDDKCFDVKANLRVGCWVMFAACVIYLIVSMFVIKKCHRALRVRMEEERLAQINS